MSPTILSREVPALIANFDLWDGTHLRAGPDERSTLEAAKQIILETEVNGGFGPATIVLPRPDQWDPMDGALLANCTIQDEADRNVHESRVSGMPHTGVNEIVFQTEGCIANTEDDNSAAEIFINRNWNDWQGMPATYKASPPSARTVVDGALETDPGGAPRMDLYWPAPWGATMEASTFFDAGAKARIGYVFGLGVLKTFSISDATHVVSIILSNSLTFAGAGNIDQTADLDGAALFGATLNATKPDRRYAALQSFHGTSNVGTADVNYGSQWLNAIVVGNHGLTLRGVMPTAGFLGSDMAAYVVNKYCQLLNVGPDSIEPTSFIIPHADFRDAETTARQMLDMFAVYGGSGNFPLDYGVYDGRQFFMKSPNTYGTQWRWRRMEGTDPSDQGQDATDRINQAICVWNPGDGSQLTVGPVGAGCDYETDQLRITDQDHTWNRIGQAKPQRFDVGVTTRDGAVAMGMLALAEKNRRQWRGSLDVAGEQIDVNGVPAPPYMIRAGDRGVVEDDLDTRERRIVHTKYDHKKRKNTVDVGSTPDRFDTILKKAGVVITDLGAS